MTNIDLIEYKCMIELNNLKYCYESTISDCIESVTHKYGFVLTEDDKNYLKRKLTIAMDWKSTLNEIFDYKDEQC